ncbi:rCG43988 [Rattus norvegicus]|uniref:RCG43988 n=1 Tax=Rattus norvegicus TaxID=10116 RepID=A6J7C6_RAT|nr:rCG43988 [Rattus norvegicus]
MACCSGLPSLINMQGNEEMEFPELSRLFQIPKPSPSGALAASCLQRLDKFLEFSMVILKQ